MSKKIPIKIQPGEAYVVMPATLLRHIQWLYRVLADEKDHKYHRDTLLEIAQMVEDWTNQTYLPFEGELDDWG